MNGSFADESGVYHSFSERVEAEYGPTLLRLQPHRHLAVALTTFADERFANLPAEPTRELLYSEFLILQQEYMRLLFRAKASQKRPLQDAHQHAYERLEARLSQVAPVQTTKPPRPKPAPKPAPLPGIIIGDVEW